MDVYELNGRDHEVLNNSSQVYLRAPLFLLLYHLDLSSVVAVVVVVVVWVVVTSGHVGDSATTTANVFAPSPPKSHLRLARWRSDGEEGGRGARAVSEEVRS